MYGVKLANVRIVLGLPVGDVVFELLQVRAVKLLDRILQLIDGRVCRVELVDLAVQLCLVNQHIALQQDWQASHPCCP